MPTNTERINEIEKTCSQLGDKIDKILDLLTSHGKALKEPVMNFKPQPQDVKINGRLEPMTTDEALKPKKSEPLLMGKVPMDNKGNITDKSWKRVKCDDGSEMYVKCKIIGALPDGTFELSDEVIDKTDTFYVDDNRKKLAEWRKSRGEIFNKSVALSEKFKSEVI